MTKYYPMHPGIVELIDQQPHVELKGLPDEELLELVDDAIEQAMQAGLVQISLTNMHPLREIDDFHGVMNYFLQNLKAAIDRGLVQIDELPEDEPEQTVNPASGRKPFSQDSPDEDADQDDLFPDDEAYENEEPEDESEQENEQQEFGDEIFSSLYQRGWVDLWRETSFSLETEERLRSLEQQDLIEIRYPDKDVSGIGQQIMLTPLGIYKLVFGHSKFGCPNEARNSTTRAFVRQARGLMEEVGYKICAHAPRLYSGILCTTDITAKKDGRLIYALVESEPFLVADARDKYKTFWSKDCKNTIHDDLYVFCENKQVLRDVLRFILSSFDVRPPGIYLCNLEDAEQTMQEKGHPWTMIQLSGRQKPKPENLEMDEVSAAGEQESAPVSGLS
jgi:hypothetical protein